MAKTIEELIIFQRTALRYLLVRESRLLALGKKPMNKKIANYVSKHKDDGWSTFMDSLNEDLTKNLNVFTHIKQKEERIANVPRRCRFDSTSREILMKYRMDLRFPNDIEKKEIWIKATHRDNFFPAKHSVVCSRHFTSDCFESLKNRRRLYGSSIPTLYLPTLTLPDDSKNTQTQSSLLNDFTNESRKSTEQFADFTNTQAQHFSSEVENIPSTSKSIQNYKSPEEHSIDVTPRKRKMKRHIDHLIHSLNRKKKDVKRLKDKTRKLKKKVASLQEILDTLTKKSLLNKENEDILKGIGVENQELIKRQQQKCLTGHIPKTKYPPKIRAFAITLHFYSPKAYDFVRKTFSTCLPCPSTLRKWYQSVDGQPGFTKEALNALKVIAKQGNQIYATIIFDEMAIKSGIEYHPQGKRFYGHVNYGAALESDCQLEAKEALVFLLVPINASFKIPIGYFLINGISSNQKASLLTQAIHLIEDTGIRVAAVTFDGCPANLSMARILGCTLEPDNLITTFKNPCNDTQVAVFLDPAHMIKLVRNALEFYQCFSDKDGQIISWQHLVDLHNLQTEEHFHLANRLRAIHIFFKCKIMKVSLATQIFSKSVADALFFCKNQLHLPQFQATSGTIDFLNMMNDLFDILDSHVHSYDFKRAVNEENAACVTHKLDIVKNEILKLSTELKMKGNEKKIVKLINSPRHTGFLGFCICIESAKHLIQELVLNKECPIKYLPLHKISQDHLEHFFGSVRSHGGSNNNPTARVFESIYKKILTYAQIKNTGTGNCGALNQISMLHCTSALNRINITTRRMDQDTVPETSNDFDVELQEEFCFTEFSTKVVEYIAGYIVHALIKKIKCQICIGALLGEQNEDSLQYQKDVRDKLMYASNTVLTICRRSEMYIKRALAECGGKALTCKYNSDYFTMVVLKSFVGYNLFPDINFHQFDVESTNHLIDLASCVAKKYIDTRLTFITKNNTDPKDYIRKTYSKLIHFKNQ